MTQKKYTVATIDDSPFSTTMLQGILEGGGYDVVGSAATLEETLTLVHEQKPDIITMDMTLIGTDGIKCSQEILKKDPRANIIMISSMMDDEIVKKARTTGIVAYLQKPVDEEELLGTIKKITEKEEMYEEIQKAYYPHFEEALKDSFNRMTKTVPVLTEEQSHDKQVKSKGISTVVGITGTFAGRIILDLSLETAKNLASLIYKKETTDKDQILATVGELTNIIAGQGCSSLNKKNKLYGLRVTPPSIFYGERLSFSSPALETKQNTYDTPFGEITLEAGLTKGDDKWLRTI